MVDPAVLWESAAISLRLAAMVLTLASVSPWDGGTKTCVWFADQLAHMASPLRDLRATNKTAALQITRPARAGGAITNPPAMPP